MPSRVQQLKAFAHLPGKTFRVVSVDGQAAALFRTIDRERPNDDISAGLDRLFHARDVGRTIRCFNQEMEGSSIMPNVEGLCGVPFGDVRDDPLHLARSFAEPRLSDFECGVGKIQHGHAAEPAPDKPIDKA